MSDLVGCSRLTTLALVLASGLTLGCGNGTEPGNGPAQYQFALEAFGGDTTAERARAYDCFVYGFFQVPQPVVSSGVARFPLRVERRLFESSGRHAESTLADSTIAEAVLEYSGLGEGMLSFVLTAGQYTTTLGPGASTPGFPTEYRGECTCGPEVPLAQDSTLLAYGYDAGLQLAGNWRVSELLPIE